MNELIDGREKLSAMPTGTGRLILASRLEEIEPAIERLLDIVAGAGYDRTAAFAIRLSLEEALSNAIVHGNRQGESRSVTLDYSIDPEEVRIEVADEGDGFVPDAVPDPTVDENLFIPSGRGLMLMRAYMSEVEWNEAGNRVRLRYRNPARS